MSASRFYRSRIPNQAFNIPQMLPGGVTIAFQFRIALVIPPIDTWPAISLEPLVTPGVEIDTITLDATSRLVSPGSPAVLDIPFPSISVLATSP